MQTGELRSPELIYSAVEKPIKVMEGGCIGATLKCLKEYTIKLSSDQKEYRTYIHVVSRDQYQAIQYRVGERLSRFFQLLSLFFSS